jgi:hypothetical protein
LAAHGRADSIKANDHECLCGWLGHRSHGRQDLRIVDRGFYIVTAITNSEKATSVFERSDWQVRSKNT